MAVGEPEGLNMVEIELSVLARQCLDRRLPDLNVMKQEIATWQQHRNQQRTTVNWRFTKHDARDKLQRLYPTAHPSSFMWQSSR